MELRITSVFNPLARAAGFFFSELGVSPTAVASTSFVAALISSFLFIFSLSIPFFSPQILLTIAVALIFVNAFLDDVERRIEVRKKKKSIFGGPLGTFLGQVSDVFIIFGALIFLSLKDTYYNFGRFLFFNLNYVEPGVAGHVGWGIITIVGILLLRYRVSIKKEKGMGLWNRSERMYLFGVFAALGILTGLFSGFLFTGVLALITTVFISLVKRALNVKGPTYSSRGLFQKTQRKAINSLLRVERFVRTLLRLTLKIIGVILLGIYMIVEKIYLAIVRIIRTLMGLRIPKRAPKQTSYRYPPIKPFEGTITPSSSTLPAESEEPSSLPPPPIELEAQTPEGTVSSHEEEATIELPPPSHLMHSDASYTGGEDVSESLLVKYRPSAKREGVLIDVAEFMMSEGKDVVIVSTQPSTIHYRDRFREVEGIRVIDLPDQSTKPEKDEIPMTNLEYFSEVFEELNNQHVFIFEPLSNLILHVGVAQTYRFVSQTMNRLSKAGITFIVFLNKVGHDKKDVSNFENLFMNIAEVEDGKLKKVR
jgi:hypothetical protein